MVMKTAGPTVHVHASAEGGIFANAYLVETPNGVVAIDGTLTVTESRAFRARAAALGKTLLGVLITHPHPDHVAGISNLVTSPDVPIITSPSVEALMRAIEAPKRAQWGPVFKDEWISRWTYPNRLIADQDAVTFDGVTYRSWDMGAGGDCDTDAAKRELTVRMQTLRPGAGLTCLIAESADGIAAELAGRGEQT